MKKIKIIAAAVALALTACSCGPSTAAASGNGYFGVELVTHYGALFLYEDTETGVQYFAWKHGYAGGICPRYNADGTLYVED